MTCFTPSQRWCHCRDNFKQEDMPAGGVIATFEWLSHGGCSAWATIGMFLFVAEYVGGGCCSHCMVPAVYDQGLNSAGDVVA
jgi:hypothetical protein